MGLEGVSGGTGPKRRFPVSRSRVWLSVKILGGSRRWRVGKREYERTRKISRNWGNGVALESDEQVLGSRTM